MVDTYSDPKSLKQFYRLWFEYLRLSLKELKWTKKEKEFYSEWGDVLSYKNFDAWWKDKGHLFGDIKVEKGSSRHEDSLNLKVPLTQPITKSINQIKVILEKEIEDRLTRVYGRKLSALDRVKNFKLNHKKFPILGEPKYRSLDDDLIIYRDVYLPNDKPKPPKLIGLVVKHFSKIKGRDENHRQPDFLQEKSGRGKRHMEEGDDRWYRQSDSMLKSLRRSLERSKKTMESVRSGQFPPKKS